MKLKEFIDKFVPSSNWYDVYVIQVNLVNCFSAAISVNQIMSLTFDDKSILEKEVLQIAPRLKSVESNRKMSFESFINITVK